MLFSASEVTTAWRYRNSIIIITIIIIIINMAEACTLASFLHVLRYSVAIPMQYGYSARFKVTIAGVHEPRGVDRSMSFLSR